MIQRSARSRRPPPLPGARVAASGDLGGYGRPPFLAVRSAERGEAA
ncbi:hypothetical protein ACFFWE_10690 [Sphaerisporangium melleum]|nr:hypothetical protein [Sphaerisporangium melleum]